jgi:hypothetical protein
VAGVGAWGIVAAAIGLALGALGPAPAGARVVDAGEPRWAQYGFDPAHTNHNQDEHILTAANAGDVVQVWKGPAQGMQGIGGRRQVVVAHSLAILAMTREESPYLWAFGTDGCGDPECPGIWETRFVDDIYGTPAVYGSSVLGATAFTHELAALDRDTGQGRWKGALGEPLSFEDEPVVLAGGSAYVATRSGVVVFATAGCGSATCSPVWRTDLPSDRTLVDAIVADGMLLVRSLPAGDAARRLDAFDADGCGHAVCPSLWHSQAILFEDPGLFGDRAGGLAASDGFVFAAGADTRLYAFPTSGCPTSPCAPAWRSKRLGGTITGLAVAGRRLYVVADGAGMVVLASPACDDPTCEVQWRAPASDGSAVVVAGDLAWLLTRPIGAGTATLSAVAAEGCGTRRCQAVAEIHVAFPGASECEPGGTPVVVGGRIFINGDSCLLTYGLGS